MELTYTPIEGKSRRYYITVAVLAVLALAGLISFIISYIYGHQVFGSSNVIPWSLPIVLAIYLIGLSAGLHILAFLIYIMGQEKYESVIKMAVFLAVVLIFGAMICIAIDLGRPEKFWRLFMLFSLNNMSSMFAINSIFYSCYLLSAVIYLASLLSNMKRFSMIMGMIAFGWAMLTHAGTGAIFGFIATRGTWFSSLSPFEFILAAFASSIALLILVVLIVFRETKRELNKEIIGSLGGLLKAFLIALLILMIVGELAHIYSPDRAPTMFMLTGPYSWLFWGFQIFLGAIIPLGILFHPKTKRSIIGIVVASVLVVIGIFVKRFYLVIPGLAYPQQYYPGHIEGVWGAVGSFPLAPAELTLSIGIFAFLALIFVLGLKFLDLLPSPVEPGPVVEESTEAIAEELAEAQE